MKFLSWDELMALPETDQIADLLRDAATAIDCHNPTSAAWRVADASLLLRRRLRRHGGVQGIDSATGCGAFLGGEAAPADTLTKNGRSV